MISIVVAIDEKRGIGKENKLLWHIPEDLRRFRQLTLGHPIIMGRKTFESIGRILPNRTNIIITRDTNFKKEGTIVVHSLESAISEAKKSHGADEIFVIGGGQIFLQSMSLAEKLYLTVVKGDFGADTFFPDYSEFKTALNKEVKTSDGYKYTFLDLTR